MYVTVTVALLQVLEKATFVVGSTKRGSTRGVPGGTVPGITSLESFTIRALNSSEYLLVINSRSTS